MFPRKDPEDFIGERLPDRRNIFEIEDDLLEEIDTNKDALRLRTRNQFVITILRESHRHYGLVECVIVSVSGVLIEDPSRCP